MTGTALAQINPDRWAMIQRMAGAFCKSELVPDAMRDSVPNCTVALLLAEQMGENPLMVMQNIFFVHGRAGWITQYMVARANTSGKFLGPLRWRSGGTDANPSETCFAKLTEYPTEDPVEIEIDLKTAVDSDWTTFIDRKDGNKKKTHARWATLGMQRQMLRWRSAAWLIRLYAPEVMFGMPTADELEDTLKDVTPPRPTIDDFKPGAGRKTNVPIAATERDQGSWIEYPTELIEDAKFFADRGSVAFWSWWEKLPKFDQEKLGDLAQALRNRAVEADEQAQAGGPPEAGREVTDQPQSAPPPADEVKPLPSVLAAAPEYAGIPIRIDEAMPPGTAAFRDPKTGKTLASAVNIGDPPPDGGEAVRARGGSGKSRAADAATQNPERAAVADPEPKPREAHSEAADLAGSSSETHARLAPGGGRRSGARGEGDGQTRTNAVEAGGSPATDIVGELGRKLTAAAQQGQKALDKAWLGLTELERDLARPMRPQYREIAQQAEAK
jgi:hypothetical protein